MARFRITVTDFCWIIWILVLYSLLSSVSSYQCRSPQAIPDIDERTYSQLGDVNIGVFISASASSGPTTCSKEVNSGSSVIEYTEAVAYAVKSVNEDTSLLANITLGFIQVNDCSNDIVALSTALSFLPRVNCDGAIAFCSDNSSASWKFTEERETDYCTRSEMPFYDVVGVIGPSTSQRTTAVSKLLATAGIPIIGCLTTGDELSDKYRHPLFSRVIPPDKYQADAMLRFIQSNGWSYISVLYVRDSFGERAFDHIKELASDFQICVATSHRVEDSSDFDYVVSDLFLYKRARVVVLFLYTQSSIRLFTSVNNLNVSGHFIWIKSDSWNNGFTNMPSDVTNNILGAFSVGLYSTYVPEYFKYLRHLKVHNTTNPWFKYQWEDLAGCSLESNESCDPDFDILTSPKFGFLKTTSMYIDSVYAFAYAIQDLIASLCPGAIGIDARRCIKGDSLLKFLRNVSFDGYNGHVQFDEFGDRRGKYEIRQIVYDYFDIPHMGVSSTIGLVAKVVAVYDVDIKVLNYTDIGLNWSYLRQLDRFVPMSEYDPLFRVPESVCSRPCVVGEYKIRRDVSCCWDCRRCRDNERITRDGTSCEMCGLLTWPDKSSEYKYCNVIPPTYPLITDTLPMILICLGTVALLCSSLVAIGYIVFRDSRVIKAASRELSITQIVAIFVGYITVIVFQTPPTHETCGALYFLFSLSFALLYAPLLVKAIRIFRIFQSGKKNNKRPRLISPCSQLVMAGILISVQMLLCLIVYIIFMPTAKSTQPIPTDKYVELSCDMTSPGLASFLAYNLVLVSLCSVFAFKTRKLPDNFNESKFISMCVSTTLVIWLAFIPTYYTSSRSSAKVMLLSVALLLNHTVALIFLFIPKIYAAAYLPIESFITSRFQTGGAGTDSFRQGLSNRVNPSTGRNSFLQVIDNIKR